MSTLTITAAEARTNFSQVASDVAATGKKITVFKNSKPWVVISPVNEESSDYVEYVRSSIIEGRKEISSGNGINGTANLKKAVNKIRNSK